VAQLAKVKATTENKPQERGFGEMSSQLDKKRVARIENSSIGRLIYRQINLWNFRIPVYVVLVGEKYQTKSARVATLERQHAGESVLTIIKEVERRDWELWMAGILRGVSAANAL
jgi:hypothetical protein